MTATTVVLADDHVPTRAGVAASLARGGFDVVASVATAPAAVEAALEHRPDVCVLDIEMPGDGIEAAKAISERLPGTAIVMLTVSESEEHLFGALRAGAAGYLLKNTNPDRLPDALRGVLAGESAIPRALVARLVEEFRAGERRRLPRIRRRFELSEREWEVLELLREGRTTKQIALELGLSTVTVRRHVSGLVARMGARDRRDAVRMAEAAEDESRGRRD